MDKSRIAIVSPSGKFYGSEQVLFDFLKTTQFQYEVYVPCGAFHDRLIEQGVHIVHVYGSANKLYMELSLRMLLNKIDGIYINEGGHSRYVTLLSKLFPWKRFFVHIRLLEDTRQTRLGYGRKNIEYISISEYITREVHRNTGIYCHTVHDLYVSTQEHKFQPVPDTDVIRAGIVGRVTDTKGLADVVKFCRYIEAKPDVEKQIELHFYGAINKDSTLATSFVEESKIYKHVKCVFHGFINNKDEIYGGVNLILHFNRVEPLGRIYLEAVDYCRLLIGFDSGGIGEIAHSLNLDNFVVNATIEEWEIELESILFNVSARWTPEVYKTALRYMSISFSPAAYTQYIEKLFYE